MRIAEISTLSRPVPPSGEGSVEYLVSLVTEELVRRGHEVTLYALPNSRTTARLRSPVQQSYNESPDIWDWKLYESFNAREAFRAWHDFDIIHCHSFQYGLLYCDFAGIPSVHSFHLDLGPDIRFLAENTRNREMIFCSRHQAGELAHRRDAHIIPHGINMENFAFGESSDREDYIAFLGRFIPEKGPLEAIELARRTGIALKMAAPENDYYSTHIKPLVDGKKVEYLGELHGHEKSEFLRRARALIYPNQRPEPFGLVIVEAMACGTPVLALDVGAVREIVQDGVTGRVCRDFDELVRAASELPAFNHRAIREQTSARFSHTVMVDQMEVLMSRLVGESAK